MYWYVSPTSLYYIVEVLPLTLLFCLLQDISEVKAYGRPPTLVETVMQAVMILKGCDPSWAEAKRQLGGLLCVRGIVL